MNGYMSKSEKSAYFRHVFAPNFFWCVFSKLFSTDLKSAWNSAFFDTLHDKKKLWLQMRRKRLKKRKTFFYECVLEFVYATIKGFA